MRSVFCFLVYRTPSTDAKTVFPSSTQMFSRLGLPEKALTPIQSIVLGRKYYYIFDKKGTFEKRIIKQQLYNRIWHNYEAESWDAMTDGMSGDFPGNEVDYDLLGF